MEEPHPLQSLKFYVVQNAGGEYFRRKGYGGSGASWVKDPLGARIYTRPRGARAVVSYFAARWPDYPTPHLIEMTVGTFTRVDESKRAADAKRKREERVLAAKRAHARSDLRRAQTAYEVAEQRLAALKASPQ